MMASDTTLQPIQYQQIQRLNVPNGPLLTFHCRSEGPPRDEVMRRVCSIAVDFHKRMLCK